MGCDFNENVAGRGKKKDQGHLGRRKQDGVRTWKIGGKLYALDAFLPRHPGGPKVLELARDGFEDSTYAFESHHTDIARAMKVLSKYEVGDADSPGPMCSKEGSFFYELKRRTQVYLKGTENGAGPDSTCVVTFATTLAAWFAFFAATLATGWLTCALLTGFCGALLAGFGHNWAHQPRYHKWAWVLDLEGLNSEGWFKHHDLEHHMYTNLPADSHFTILEPFLVTNPTAERHWLQATITPYLTPVLFFIASFVSYLVTTVEKALGTAPEPFYPTFWLQWMQIVVLMSAHGWWGLALAVLKNGIMSEWYLTIAFINHNTDNAWRMKDRAHAKDWAEAQLCASSDIGHPRLSFMSSARYLWLNYHTVHHLFPHTDMSKHPGIQAVMEQCCEDFGISYCRGKSMWTLYVEMVNTFKEPKDLLNQALRECTM